jgi:hypothetical protein
MNKEVTSATTDSAVKIYIGSGMSNSAIKGEEAYAKRPNKLQIPNAVPQSVVGKIQGVAI